MNASTENFESLLDDHMESKDFGIGDVVYANVLSVTDKFVLVDLGLKSEGTVPVHEYQELPQVGEQTKVYVSSLDLVGSGHTVVSHKHAIIAEEWKELERKFHDSETVKGVVTGVVNGGLTLQVGLIQAFLPRSLVSTTPTRNINEFVGQELEVKILSASQAQGNAVVSRRELLEEARVGERAILLESLEEGKIIKGVVKNITDYGAFVDLGGIDGLLHITDMAWKRVSHPSEIVNVGEEINVKVLKFDRDTNRVSLGIKQVADNPWTTIESRYKVGMRVKGRVTNITDYGAFVELEDGVEGLVHTSQISWVKKQMSAAKVLSVGEEIEVMILDIDSNNHRIGLGRKQCEANPWDAFAASHKVGDIVKGEVSTVTDFGMFISLPVTVKSDSGEERIVKVDGLVHETDLSWGDVDVKERLSELKLAGEVEAKILDIGEQERISLGIKQLDRDPVETYLANYKLGDEVSARFRQAGTGYVVDLAEDVVATVEKSAMPKTVDLNADYKFTINNPDKLTYLKLTIVGEPAGSASSSTSGMTDIGGDITSASLGDLLKSKVGRDSSE